MIPVLFVVTILVFSIIRFIPGEPARLILGEKATEEAVAALTEKLGLNEPLLTQYLLFLKQIFTLDFGNSFTYQMPVSELLASRFPVTLALTLMSILGPKGLMPNPKAGTVTMDVTKAINDIKAGKIEYRLDKTNIIHVPIGKASFTEEQLADNFQTLIDAINKARPSAVKGQYLKSITLTSTMGPGVKVNPMKLA